MYIVQSNKLGKAPNSTTTSRMYDYMYMYMYMHKVNLSFSVHMMYNHGIIRVYIQDLQ